MYICPTCGEEFEKEEVLVKHFLKCWKGQNPHHKSKPAPRSENITTTEVSEDIMAFFDSLKGDDDNERSNG